MSFSLLAAAVLVCATGAPTHVGPQSARDELLVTPAPYPANRVDSPARAQNGRLWVSGYPLGGRIDVLDSVFGEPGPGAYGAPLEAVSDVIFVRENHVPIAVSPWLHFSEDGFERFELARNTWLREQGYILKVRTHVNAAHFVERGAMYSRAMPTPSATIRINDDLPRRPSRLRVEGPVMSLPITRVSTPAWAVAPCPIRVVEPETTTAAATPGAED